MQVKRVDKSSAVNGGDSSSWVLPAASICIDKSKHTSAHRVIRVCTGYVDNVEIGSWVFCLI